MWSEELIGEWLQLNEYHIRVGIPLGTKVKGGRGEADVIGLKIIGGKPHIIHIEVGNLGNSADINFKIIEKKFSEENKRHVLNAMGLPEDTSWESRYIATWVSNKSLSYIKQKGYKIDRLEKVLRDEIIPDILDWKEREVKSHKTTQPPTPPMKLDLICLLDFLMQHEFLKEEVK